MRLLNRFALLAFLVIFLSACAGTEPVVVDEAPPPPPPPSSPLDGYMALVLEADAVVLSKSTSELERSSASGSLTFVSPSPGGSSVAVAVGGTLLVVNNTDGSVHKLDEGAPERVFTGAWSRDGSLFHYGVYMPANGGMGEGDIRTIDTGTGIVSRVGCSASKAVLAALEDGSLLVRNTDNIYQVETEGCGTIRTIDARKLHHVSASPDGRHLAYILRELVYNREERAYEPDSTLYIETTEGSDPIKVIGDKYAPRNLSWRPDGSELLYDVAPPADDALRAVSIYTLADARSSYMLPPSSSSSATHGLMSPGGQHVLFRQTGSDGMVDWQVKTTGSNFAQSLPMPSGDVTDVYWVDDNLMIMHTEDSSYLVSVSGTTPELTDFETHVAWIWSAQ